MTNELKTILKKNDTFDIVNRPLSKDCIGSRFVLINKYNQDGTILKHKARLVTRGFSQKPGIDFGETFAPVARMESIRLMTSFTAKLHTSAYLNGKLDEEIFMECPDYFDKIFDFIINENSDSIISRKVAKILKSFNKGNKVLFQRNHFMD